MAPRQVTKGSVGLVLAGGGARGAYEIGVLSALLPALQERDQRPDVIVGTSVGALNAAFLAARAHLPAAEAVDQGVETWQDIRFSEAVRPVFSAGTLARLYRYVGQFLGLRRARLYNLLDPSPLHDTFVQDIQFPQIQSNVHAKELRAAAVVATSAGTSRSVVFHCGGNPPAHDDRRGIDYVESKLSEEHVLASAAIPGVFPAVHISDPQQAVGWYFDGGIRLNTPIKPALELGVERVVVIGLNPIAPLPPRLAEEKRPDALEGAGQLAQALLVDPLVHDVQTLATINQLVRASDPGKVVPYMLVAPRRNAIGRMAREVFDEHYRSLCDTLRASDIAFLGRLVAGGSDALHGELLSYLFFAPQFTQALIEMGRRDGERWLKETHEQDIWEIGPS